MLLLVTRQTKVFRIEFQHKDNDYPGGMNKYIVHEMESPNYVNPIPDFISDKKYVTVKICFAPNIRFWKYYYAVLYF